MAKRDYGYLIPDPVAPLTRKCVQLFIPDSANHIAAFWGALNTLSVYYNWENPESIEAQQAAEVWRNVIAAARQTYESSEECGSQVEFRNVGGNIEWRPDSFAGWTSLGVICPCEDSGAIPVAEYNPDVTTVEELACSVAMGLNTWLWEKLNDELDQIDEAADFAAAIDAVTTLFAGPVYLIIDAVTDAIKEVTAMGTSVVRAYDSVERREYMAEYLYCRMLATSGEMTEEIWEELKDDVQAGDGGFSTFSAGNLGLYYFLSQLKWDTVNSRARIESYSAPQNCAAFNCSGEEWTHEFNFATSGLQGWTKRLTTDPDLVIVGGEGIYPTVINEGGTITQRLFYAKRELEFADSTTRLTSLRAEWDGVFEGNNTAATRPAARISTMNTAGTHIEGETTAPLLGASNIPAGGRTVSLGGTQAYLDTDFLRLFFSVGQRTTSPAVNSDGYVTKFIVTGTGKNPFVA